MNSFNMLNSTSETLAPAGYKFNFGAQGTGSITNYTTGSYRFYWNSQGIRYKFLINVFENVSKFSQGTSVNMIKDYVSQALKYGSPIKGGFEYTFGNAIGTNIQGGAAFSLRVFVRDGWVTTAFPF